VSANSLAEVVATSGAQPGILQIEEVRHPDTGLSISSNQGLQFERPFVVLASRATTSEVKYRAIVQVLSG
jgi:hypothetical protein